MDIRYLGHSSFQIKTKDAKLVTDPYNNDIGIRFPKTEADIVTISHHHSDHNNTSNLAGDPLILDWPGEFECKGIRITGYPTFHDKKKGEERGPNVMYKIEGESITILHCGDLGHLPSDEFLEDIGTVDILMVPVGGVYTIDANDASELVHKLEPSITIPMHFQQAGLNKETFGKLSGVDEFIKKIGIQPEESTGGKLSLKKGDINEEEMKVYILEIDK